MNNNTAEEPLKGVRRSESLQIACKQERIYDRNSRAIAQCWTSRSTSICRLMDQYATNRVSCIIRSRRHSPPSALTRAV